MEKTIGKYKIKFSGDFSEKTDKLSLTIKIDDPLREFLRTCVSSKSGAQDLEISLGPNAKGINEVVTVKRYLIKTPLSSSINYITYHELPFIKGFIDNGSVTFEFNAFDNRDKLKRYFKEVIKKLLEISNNEKIDETVTFNLNEQ